MCHEQPNHKYLTPFPSYSYWYEHINFASSPLDNPSDNTRFFCTYHLAG